MANGQKQRIPEEVRLLGILALGLIFGAIGVAALIVALRRLPVSPTLHGPGSAAGVSSLKPHLPEGMIAVAGKHVVIHALPVERARATALVPFGDAAVEKYAHDLGAALPRDPIAVYLLDTMKDLRSTFIIAGREAISHNPGFAHGGSAFLYHAPRPGETIDADSRISHMLDHELCHALHQRLFPNSDFQPSWLQEGLAEAWSERALSGHDALTADQLLWTSARMMTLRTAVERGDRLDVTQILLQPYSAYSSGGAVQQNLAYCRAFALVRMLDDPAPANAARRVRFRAFLEEANILRGENIEDGINCLFLQRFGGAHLAELQAELESRVKTEKLFPWKILGENVRRLPDGSLRMEVDSEHSALAFADRSLSPTIHLHARVDVANSGRPHVSLLFSGTAPDDYYALMYKSGYVTLFHYQNEFQIIGFEAFDPKRFAPGSHTLDVTVFPQRVESRLDGRRVGSIELPSGSFPRGQWGIGAYAGRVTFHGLSARDSSR